MPDSDTKSTATAAPRPALYPKELSPEYHKARKQLMLWSAILFIWELVGIDLEKAKEAGGNAGAIIVAIKSPQAVPWALLILVVYFLIKCWIEWAQCRPERRKVVFARIDFYLAGFVAFLSIALYAGQAIRRVQFANLGTKNSIASWIGTALGAASLLIALAQLSSRIKTWYLVRLIRKRHSEKLPNLPKK